MPLVDNAWYVNFGNGSSTGHYAIAQWAAATAYAAGALRRQLAAPAVGSERVFVCVVAGTSHATTEPTWTLTRGAKTTDNTVTWQECSGIAALNGDATNTPSWTVTATPPGGVKNIAVVLGQVIKRDNGASYQICTTSGTAGNGSEPAFSDTAGTTTADNTVTWTSLGVVGNFTGWQAPHARIANAYVSTWGQAGNAFNVASEHAETQATAITQLCPGTTVAPCDTRCVTKTNVPPVSGNLTTGASVTTTGTTNITVRGEGTWYGFNFNCGTGSGAPSLVINQLTGVSSLFASCTFALVATGNAVIFIGNTADKTSLLNSTFSFSQALQQICSTTFLEWVGGSISGTMPTVLFGRSFAVSGKLDIRGVDLSLAASGSTLFSTDRGFHAVLNGCKLGASVVVASLANRTSIVDLVRCDSGATNYRHERYQLPGSQVVETTIVRTGGATDGTTPIAWKIVTGARAYWSVPFASQSITLWNDTVGSAITVTLYGIWGGGAVPNNDDIWIEAEYLGSTLTPIGSFANSTKADNLAAGSALSSDSSTWGGSTTKFKMAVTFTPQMKGPISITIKAAKTSSTFYIDPQPEISGVTVSRSFVA